jgi:hypothetical protein
MEARYGKYQDHRNLQRCMDERSYLATLKDMEFMILEKL